MPPTVMVRARPETRDKLRAISEREGVSAVEMLDRLVQAHEDATFLAALAADLATPAAKETLAAWDSSPWDGLDPDEDFSWVGSDTERS